MSNTLEYYDDWKNALDIILKYEYDFINSHARPLWSWFKNNNKRSC